MLAAVFVYVAASGTSVSPMKGMLVDSPQFSTEGEVRVNDKAVEPETLKRLAARAAQLALQKNDAPASSFSSSSEAVPPKSAEAVVADHADRTAWISMRQTRRDLSSVYDLAKNAAAPIVPPPDIAVASAPASVPMPLADAETLMPSSGKKSLPDSGPMLNVALCVAFGLACLRKRSAIAARVFAS